MMKITTTRITRIRLGNVFHSYVYFMYSLVIYMQGSDQLVLVPVLVPVK